jgi:dTDP-4-dehydrorhamnose 3,5-epimerase
MKFIETGFDALKVVEFFNMTDDRGIFIKPFVPELVPHFGQNIETYFSSSHKGVFRGLHFQDSIDAQSKFVVCLKGKIEDVAIDMRKEKSTYGKVFRKTLLGLTGEGVVIPQGFAHGIYAYEDSIIVNFCNNAYSPGNEGGINPLSVTDLQDLKIDILSDKDKNLPFYEQVISSL